MENRNVILAVVLSTIILIFWQVVYVDPELKKQETQKQVQTTETVKNNEDKPQAPQIKSPEPQVKITREESLKKTNRIILENKHLKGSISLKGALIDDVELKKYTEQLDPKSKKVIILNPKTSEDPYYIETGWATSNKLLVPNNESNWVVKNNQVLTPSSPVILEWNNNQGLIFSKKFEIDDEYLITVTESIKNNTNNKIDLFLYSQINRNIKPFVQGFYILHEGLLGVVDDVLKEEKYDDLIKKKQTFKGSNGWLGITDKYWLTTIIPSANKKFNAEFLYNQGFKVNYIITDPTTVDPGKSNSISNKIFVGAKEVAVIDQYSKKEKINKFDLAIDWGWFYFFTKPLFFFIDYLFKLCGNFGLAIVILTTVIRLLFYPLANYSFKSMAKMKAVQPELQRLKDLYKDDKQKIQIEMMNLYKREKINPLSGCLPVLIQIPFFFAIYKMLFVTIEMRHAPFFGWVKDLSAPDPTTLFNLFGLMPWSVPTFLMIGAWPIMMGITMWIQQKLNPAPADPIQAKIFAYFPFVFTILLASFPSGLVIYWTVNNLLTIAQQYVITKKTTVKTV